MKKQDASGDTSSTAKAEKGIKAKTLTVTTQIRYKDESDLRELIRVSEAKGRQRGQGLHHRQHHGQRRGHPAGGLFGSGVMG